MTFYFLHILTNHGQLNKKFKKSPKIENQNKETERDLYSLQNFIAHEIITKVVN